MVGRSRSLEGPYVDAAGVSMVDGGHVNFLKSSPPMFSPGHCEVMQDADGKYVISYHFYDSRHYWQAGLWGLPRLQIREMLWSDDGWPLPGFPIEYRPAHEAAPNPSLVGTWRNQPDFGEPGNLEFRADGTFVSNGIHGTWTKQGHDLTLHWPRPEAPREFWTDRLILAYGDNYYVGRNQAGMVVRGTRIGIGSR
jgi:arabinan endo-1,5-alpha-L-arabinosidase